MHGKGEDGEGVSRGFIILCMYIQDIMSLTVDTLLKLTMLELDHMLTVILEKQLTFIHMRYIAYQYSVDILFIAGKLMQQ